MATDLLRNPSIDLCSGPNLNSTMRLDNRGSRLQSRRDEYSARLRTLQSERMLGSSVEASNLLESISSMTNRIFVRIIERLALKIGCQRTIERSSNGEESLRVERVANSYQNEIRAEANNGKVHVPRSRYSNQEKTLEMKRTRMEQLRAKSAHFVVTAEMTQIVRALDAIF